MLPTLVHLISVVRLRNLSVAFTVGSIAGRFLRSLLLNSKQLSSNLKNMQLLRIQQMKLLINFGKARQTTDLKMVMRLAFTECKKKLMEILNGTV